MEIKTTRERSRSCTSISSSCMCSARLGYWIFLLMSSPIGAAATTSTTIRTNPCVCPPLVDVLLGKRASSWHLMINTFPTAHHLHPQCTSTSAEDVYSVLRTNTLVCILSTLMVPIRTSEERPSRIAQFADSFTAAAEVAPVLEM